VDAARAKATVGEISEAIEKVWAATRPRSAPSKASTGGGGKGPKPTSGRSLAVAFEKPMAASRKSIVAKMGQDGHDRGQKVVATAFWTLASMSRSARCSRRRKKLPPKQAIDSEVTSSACVVARGRSPDAGAGTEALRLRNGRGQRHHDRGRRDPAAGLRRALRSRRLRIFPPGTVIADAAVRLLTKLSAKLGYSQEAVE
jgi:methylmalonyl-CoA mutase